MFVSCSQTAIYLFIISGVYYLIDDEVTRYLWSLGVDLMN